jgi:hypothetical protein
MIGSMTWRKFLRTPLVVLTIQSAILAAVSGCGIAKPHQESVVVKDTVVVITKERVLHDTLTIQKDTILYQDRVKVEIRYLEGETMVVTAECPSDTVTITQVKIVQSKASKSKVQLGRVAWMDYCYFVLVGHHPNSHPKTDLRCFSCVLRHST